MSIPSYIDEGIEKNFDRCFFDKKLTDYLRRDGNQRPILSNLQNYDERLITEEGKRFRAFLPVIMANGFDIGLDKEQIHQLFVPIEAIHGVSLVLDDVIDRDELRRGMRTTHEVMKDQHLSDHQANSVTSLDAFYLQSRAERIPLKLDFISTNERIRISEAVGGSIERLCNGQILDVAGENLLEDREILSKKKEINYLDFYKEVLGNKTAPLFELGPKILEIVSGKELDNLKRYSYHLAMAYQVRDDVIDIEGPREGDDINYEKDRFSDVREGNVTLPIFYALKSLEDCSSKEVEPPSKQSLDQNGKELLEILNKDCLNQKDEKRVEQIIGVTDAIKQSNSRIRSHLEEARVAISNSDVNNDQKELLDEIAKYAAKREV